MAEQRYDEDPQPEVVAEFDLGAVRAFLAVVDDHYAAARLRVSQQPVSKRTLTRQQTTDTQARQPMVVGLTADRGAGQIMPARSAYATAWERLRSLSRCVTP